MPRLDQVPRSQIKEPVLQEVFQRIFDDRDPIEEPGTATGSAGNYWSVLAHSPEVFEWVFQGIQVMKRARELEPHMRELAMVRAGWVRGSQFVFSQHCKALRSFGVPEEKVESVPYWATADCYDDLERLVLAYTDDLVSGGGRVPDERFQLLRKHLSDRAILELTYIVGMYEMHATVCRALRVEWDDRDDPIIEVRTGDESTDSADFYVMDEEEG